MRRPHLDVLVVVATEDVERLRRRDRLLDHRHRVGHGQGELDAEVRLRLLLNLGSRPLDAERDHAQRPGVLALLRRRRRGSACERADARHRRSGCATFQKEVTAAHPAGLLPGLGSGQALMLAQLLDELISVDLEVVRHARTPFSSPSARRSSLPTRAHPTHRQQHTRCRNRSENEWRSAVECSLYTGPSRTSQLASTAGARPSRAGTGIRWRDRASGPWRRSRRTRRRRPGCLSGRSSSPHEAPRRAWRSSGG